MLSPLDLLHCLHSGPRFRQSRPQKLPHNPSTQCSVVRSGSLEQAGDLVVAVMQQLMDFATCYLEKSKFSSDEKLSWLCVEYKD
ncbi:hypothetical protein Pint_30788 [Pistacia integerrima]|uniref:Uncharacterized protein n=1 Tax=Pistacia integerrima TaxID=434235 RepID=A0ACC0WZF7_9ROSI|nr:hypothetical protein Pint_30788 [Pistacia integerrima]